MFAVNIIHPSIHRQLKKNPRLSVRAVLNDLGFDIGLQTARDYIHKAGIYGRRPRRVPFISPLNRLRRVKWAKSWGSYDFTEVVFTDEKNGIAWPRVINGYGDRLPWPGTPNM